MHGSQFRRDKLVKLKKKMLFRKISIKKPFSKKPGEQSNRPVAHAVISSLQM